MPKKITVDHLARMVKEAVDEMATKQEMRAGFQAVMGSLDFLKQEIREIKEVNRIILGPLARGVAEAKEYYQSIEKRVSRLERKVGLGR